MTIATEAKTLKNFIGGVWVEALSQKTEAVPNPATGEILAYVPISGREDLDRPASLNSSARRLASSGVRSDGFKIKVLPQAIARGNIQQGTIMGKLNGVIPPMTPMG